MSSKSPPNTKKNRKGELLKLTTPKRKLRRKIPEPTASPKPTKKIEIAIIWDIIETEVRGKYEYMIYTKEYSLQPKLEHSSMRKAILFRRLKECKLHTEVDKYCEEDAQLLQMIVTKYSL